ncbi:DUF3789 domain-containing protein [Enterococcus faecalis]|nr:MULTISPECIES: DUF3789 domain-containing protein [Enterococcus]MBC9721904.1 DUF3789 domain-containing protein [Lactobacillus sp.]EGO7946516.1 DUF3789 domain-containing protein [Enterococcus faecalis]EIY8109107.1 DUF3789 domain-containing protein [Enterococcus faecalis]EKQ3637147.1 DUF3789 domain-containing protein [Enterococcus faecalis]PQD42483.1 DUF3789 domain-containing protein [Enterococcus faecalis]
MNILSGLLLFFLGGFIGVATMCIVQVGNKADFIMNEQEKQNNEKK